MVYIRAVSGKDVGWVVFLFIKDLGGGSDWTPENSKMSSWLTTSPLAHRAAFAARDYVCTEKEGRAQQQSDGVRFCVVGKRITLPQVMEKSTFESRAFLFSPSQQGGKGVFITFFFLLFGINLQNISIFYCSSRCCHPSVLNCKSRRSPFDRSVAPSRYCAGKRESHSFIIKNLLERAGCWSRLRLLFLCLGDFSSQLVGSFTSSPIERKSFVGNN